MWPIEIMHVDLLKTMHSTIVLPRAFLCVFWAGTIPLGHVYGETLPDQRIPIPELTKRAGIHWPRTIESTKATTLSAAVVICTRDRPSLLARCLNSLRSQTLSPTEVCVIDNLSQTDETRKIAIAAGAEYVREDRPGGSIARNTGALRTKSEIVCYADDDVELHTEWLKQLVSAFDSEAVLAVTGLVLPAELSTEAQCRFEYQWGFSRGYNRRDYGPQFYNATRRYGCPVWTIATGGNMALRRGVFNTIGLFDERLGPAAAGCSEDSELWYRILHNGGTCRYEPRAVVFHHHRKSAEAMREQIRGYMRGHTAALLIQYERTGDLGNLRRLFLSLPWGYLRRILKRLLIGRTIDSKHMLVEIYGCLQGIVFYAQRRWLQ
jgi:GT2 family glycosyltransferase